MSTVNDLFTRWSNATGENRRSLEFKFYDSLVRFARKLVRYHMGEDVEDLAHDVATDSFMSLIRFRGDAKVSTWMWKIAKFKCVDEIRRRQKQRRRESLYAPEVLDAKFAHPHDRLGEIETEVDTERLLERMPEPARRVMIASLQGKDQKDIANECGITPRAAASRRRRCIEWLKNLVKA